MNIPELHESNSRVGVVTDADTHGAVLSPAEMVTYDTYTGVKKVNWLLGRMAGKRALQDYSSHYSPEIALYEIRVAAAAELPSCFIDGVEQTDLLLSLSHTKGRYGAAVVASAAAYTGVGIDIEIIRDFNPTMVESFCTAAEYRYWLMVPATKQAEVATAFWTLKEAYMKALPGRKHHPRHFDSLYFIDNPSGGTVGNIKAKWTIVKKDSILAVLYNSNIS